MAGCVPGYVPLWVQSHYSFRQGREGVAERVAGAARLGFPALALADRDGLWGVWELEEAARHHGLKPIPACTLTVDLTDLVQESPCLLRPPLFRSSAHPRLLSPVLLLATEPRGYTALSRAVTEAHLLAGANRSPALPASRLSALGTGIAAILCLPGSIEAELLRRGDRCAAGVVAALAGHLTGPVYIALSRDIALNRAAQDFSQAAGLPTVAALPGPDPLVPPEDLQQRLPAHALAASVEIAAACRPALPEPGLRLPRFPTPEGVTEDSFLATQAWEGLARRGKARDLPYRQRLDRELATVHGLGLSGYFLVFWDLVTWARQEGIPVGPGRGSAVGSLLAWALGITDVDPVAHGLYFERFLHPQRADLPDIDLDVCSRERPRLLRYLQARYPAGTVAQVGLPVTLGARGAVREAGRRLGTPPHVVDTIARLLPSSRGRGGLKAALETLPEFRRLDLKQEPVRSLLETAQALEGRAWGVSVHAAGVVVGPGPLAGIVPLQWASGGELITQCPPAALGRLGLAKLDLLGLRNLTAIADVERAVPGLQVRELPLDDGPTYALLRSGETLGVFQLDSPGMRRLIRELGPREFRDLVAILSLYRPAPWQGGAVTAFLRRRRGEEPVTFPHPRAVPYLEETYGLLLYQEQILGVATAVAGMALGEADDLRRSLARGPQAAAAWERRFLDGARATGVAPDEARQVWEWLVRSSGYSFNKAHTTAYALLTYWTAYLKAHHPAPHLAAVLARGTGYFPAAVYLQEAVRMGLAILPPDVNRSGLTFQSERLPGGGAGIRLGLLQVPGVGPRAAATVLADREARGAFTGPGEFRVRGRRAGVPATALEALIRSGAAGPDPQLTIWDFLESKHGTPGGPPPAAGGEGFAPTATAAAGVFEVPPAPVLEAAGCTPSIRLGSLPAGKRCRVGGRLLAAHRRPTEDGIGLLLLLQDSSGMAEVIVPPAVYARDVLEIDPRGLWVEGRVVAGGRLVADSLHALMQTKP